jgi:hypothetical protein
MTDPSERGTDPAPPLVDFPDEEPETGVVCLACGALAQRLVEGGVTNACRWCTQGIMSAAEIVAWKNRKVSP